MGKDEFKLGQTKELNPTAADSEALTTFYSTLLKQRPDSEMAARFLLQHGLLPDEDLQKVYKKYGKGAGASSSKSGGSSSQPKKKPAANDDDDFEKKPAKKAPAKKAPAKKAEPDSSDEEFAAKKPAPAKKAPPAKRPVVNNDDDSSEDDAPLAKKTKK